jgi:hypothetical protein
LAGKPVLQQPPLGACFGDAEREQQDSLVAREAYVVETGGARTLIAQQGAMSEPIDPSVLG